MSERGACRNDYGGASQYGFLCSECGAFCYRMDITRAYTDANGKTWYTTDLQGVGLHYCPSCGRRIAGTGPVEETR